MYRPDMPSPAADPCCDGRAHPALPATGSRRRRLWEFEPHVHCPVIGVCLPIAALRRLVDKRLGGQALADDYELHCGAIAECRLRSPLAEALHKELDRRFAPALRQARALKTTAALAAWWHDALATGRELPGSFWATLTHPRCMPELEHQVLGQVHMRQHQMGMATRVELARFEALIDENAVLARELAAAQQRSMRQAAEHARRADALEHGHMQTRAELIARTTELAALRERQTALAAAAPDLGTRFELARDNRALVQRLQDLQRALQAAQQEAERQRSRAEQAERRCAEWASQAPPAPAGDERPLLADRAVLCVGGRSGSVPAYRQLVERTGGRFLHHDGGAEDNAARLDATLAAADLVICQTGCVSHDAYWRVKDHCKRTGKRCVFVDTPSRSALLRALDEVRGEVRGEVDGAALAPAD